MEKSLLTTVVLLFAALAFVGSRDGGTPEAEWLAPESAAEPASLEGREVALQGASISAESTARAAAPAVRRDASVVGLLVTVRNPAGMPVDGVDVNIGLVSDDPQGQRKPSRERHLSPRTDTEGRVIVPWTELEDVLTERPEAPWCVEVDDRVLTPVRATFRATERPSEAVALVLDVARVAVAVLTPDGEPWRERAGLSVMSTPGVNWSHVAAPPLHTWVPLAASFQLGAYRCGTYRDAEAEFPSVLDPHVEHTCTVRLGPRRPSLRGRIALVRGDSLPAKPLIDFMRRDGSSAQVDSAVVDPLGNFEATCASLPREGTLLAFRVDLRMSNQDRNLLGFFETPAPRGSAPPSEPPNASPPPASSPHSTGTEIEVVLHGAAALVARYDDGRGLQALTVQLAPVSASDGTRVLTSVDVPFSALRHEAHVTRVRVPSYGEYEVAVEVIPDRLRASRRDPPSGKPRADLGRVEVTAESPRVELDVPVELRVPDVRELVPGYLEAVRAPR